MYNYVQNTKHVQIKNIEHETEDEEEELSFEQQEDDNDQNEEEELSFNQEQFEDDEEIMIDDDNDDNDDNDNEIDDDNDDVIDDIIDDIIDDDNEMKEIFVNNDINQVSSDEESEEDFIEEVQIQNNNQILDLQNSDIIIEQIQEPEPEPVQELQIQEPEPEPEPVQELQIQEPEPIQESVKEEKKVQTKTVNITLNSSKQGNLVQTPVSVIQKEGQTFVDCKQKEDKIEKKVEILPTKEQVFEKNNQISDMLDVIESEQEQSDIEEKLEEPKFYKGDFEKDLEDLINKIEIGTD